MDKDIKTSLKNLHDQEAVHGAMAIPSEDVQLEEQREPLLTWKPTPPKSHPVDYFVPDFGKDHEIADSQRHEGEAEKKLKHTWTPKKDEDDKWVLPSHEIEFHLL